MIIGKLSDKKCFGTIIGWGGGGEGRHIVPFLCFSFICNPITTKLGMMVLWDKISQKP